MSTKTLVRGTGRTIGYGAIGGFVGSLAMIPLEMAIAIVSGMPANAVVQAMGLMFGANMDNAMMVGLGMHMLTGSIIGVIFGAIVGGVGKLRITGYGKGIGLGVAAGMIAFAVLFIPISMLAMPPVLMKMMSQMNPGMSQQQIMTALQGAMPGMIGISAIAHLIYGVVLGGVTSVLLAKTRPKQ